MCKVRVAAAALLLFTTSALLAQNQSTSTADIDKRVESILSQMTLEEKIDYIGGVRSFYIRDVKRLGVPELKMADGPLGVRNYGPSTTYAAGIALAASWDPELARRVGEMIARDAKARGVHFMLGPGVNIYRAPMCGRNFEYFGEDPYLASRTAVAYIEGMQSQGVSATIKHFMANNSEFDRHNTDSELDERTAREIYLPTFEAAVKEAHVGAIMDSYNLVNGVHMTQNDHFNNEVVKKEWGFDGIIMSDWDATYDGVAAANDGLDLEMPSGKFMNRQTLMPAVQQGKVSAATIDDKVRRILRTALRFGWFDHDQTDLAWPLYSRQSDQVALEGARASMVLLKNDGDLLPLDKTSVKSIAVIGPDAYPAVPDGGGSAQVRPFEAVSYLQGISDYLGNGATVYYNRGARTLSEIFDASDFLLQPGGQRGLKGEYFNNATLQGPPDISRTDEHVNFLWKRAGYQQGGPRENYSVRWTGYFVPQTSDDFRFFARVNGESDTFRLYLDDKLVLERTNRTATGEYTVPLQAGQPHAIRFEYSHGDGYAGAGLGAVPIADLVDAAAKTLASRADVAVVLAGFDPSSESEGFDRTFQLPIGQDELINQIRRSNPKTVVVLTSGGGSDMAKWIDHVPALIQAWYPGQEGGRALAEIVVGDVNPSGRLPVTFDRRWEESAVHDSYYPQKDKRIEYSEGVFVGYRHYDKSGVKPLFPFGYGLSYTTFEYSNLTIFPQNVSGDGRITVSFDLQNTGKREGAEVAQVYVGDGHAKVPRPPKELKGYAKVNLKPGEKRHVSITLNRRAMSYYDVNSKSWRADPGAFEVLVGRNAQQIELRGQFTLADTQAARAAD